MINVFIVLVVFVFVAGFIVYTQEREDVPENTTPVIIQNNDTEESLDTAENTDDSSEQTDYEKPVIGTDLVLDLSGQTLRNTPNYVFGNTDIQKLDLSNNSLDGSLQAEVRQLQNLKILNLSNNQFTGVPAEIGQLNNLEILDLSNNQLTGLPHELGNLSNLRVLDLRGNNYAPADLDTIKDRLPRMTEILAN